MTEGEAKIEEKVKVFNKEVVAKLKELSDDDMVEVIKAKNSVLRMGVEYQNNNNQK